MDCNNWGQQQMQQGDAMNMNNGMMAAPVASADKKINTVLCSRLITKELLVRIKNMNKTYSMSLNDALTVCNTLNIADGSQPDDILAQQLMEGFTGVVYYITSHRTDGSDLTKELNFLAAMCGVEVFFEINNCIVTGTGQLQPEVNMSKPGSISFKVNTGVTKNLNYLNIQ